jgi:hypothetical protein
MAPICVGGTPILALDAIGPSTPTASTYLATPASAEIFSQPRGQFGFPVPDGFMAEYDAAEKEHLAQISQAQLVAQAPEHHEGDDVGGELCPVQSPTAALIELLTAAAAAEPAVAPGGALQPLRNGGRAALHAPHLSPPLRFPHLNSVWPSYSRGASGEPLDHPQVLDGLSNGT